MSTDTEHVQAMSEQTPRYKNPPVIETVLGVQFPELPEFRCAHFGTYGSRIKDRYPDCVDQARLPPVNEIFPRPSVGEIQFRLTRGAEPQRVWYSSSDGSELIQLQPDRYLFNWRKGDTSAEYPSYSVNADKFLKLFDEFRRSCREDGLEEPTPELVEVSYINHIRPEPDESAVGLLSSVFSGLQWQTSDGWLPIPEIAGFDRSYVIGANRGRLHTKVGIAVDRSSKSELVRFELTARVPHRSQDSESIEESLRLAHDWVVNGFASLTSLEAQRKRWNRIT